MRLLVKIIGVTGGIAMGKTTVSQRLEGHHGLKVLDADVYARDAVAIGSPVLSAIVQRYGSRFLLPDGQLDRAALGRLVFADSTERTWLEAQIHPEVRDRMQTDTANFFQVQNVTKTLDRPIIWVVPLLFETAMTELVEEIWVIYCDRQQQLQRLCNRSSLTREEAEARIAAQWDIQVKCDRADVILDNSGPVESLYEQISQALWHNHGFS
jgi:dephospho-CoA kinase